MNSSERDTLDTEDVLECNAMYEEQQYRENGYSVSNSTINCICEGTCEPKLCPYVSVLAQCYNYLGMIWTSRSDHETAERCFKRAERVYKAFHRNALHLEEKDPLVKQMENMITMTTFYLAQMYSQLKFPHLSAKYCFLTLKRQLKSELEFDRD